MRSSARRSSSNRAVRTPVTSSSSRMRFTDGRRSTTCQYQNTQTKKTLKKRSDISWFASCRCVEQDFGFEGCGINVTSAVHNRCSGRRECSISIPDSDLQNRLGRECGEMWVYFNASYRCVPGECPLYSILPSIRALLSILDKFRLF